MRKENDRPLHENRVDQPFATLNRFHILVHVSVTLAVLYYRVSRLPLLLQLSFTTLAWILLIGSELLLFFLWILAQAYRWRPISRTVFPERLPEDGSLPPIDVFIVTADPDKEPTVEVMNTLISIMSLDYPTSKLHVYLSDDGGSPITLSATRLAYDFARSWVPFCRRYKIETRYPAAYFSGSNVESVGSPEFQEERQRIKLLYESFKKNVEKEKDKTKSTQVMTKRVQDQPSCIEIIKGDQEMSTSFEKQAEIPLLVYVSREKRKNHPHHFKAGALNVLLRISGIISNSPYILVLDCDMYTNNPASVRQAMCFHLDPHLSPSLAFVQFPQNFHNISKNDIYCAELRSVFEIQWKGCDGLKGPILSGTGFYIKRNALYGARPGQKSTREGFNSTEIAELKQSFGSSNEFIASFLHNRRNDLDNRATTYACSQEATLLASCTYEIDTQWGEQMGFLYGSVVEDYFTGFHLHCRGWNSAYYIPPSPAFLGSVPTSFSDTLIQRKRWMYGLLEVGFSRFCPLTFGISSATCMLQNMCYAWQAFQPLDSFSLLCYGIIPQLCFLNGISLFPEVSSPWFAAFVAVHLSSLSQHLREVLYSKGSLRTWWNELRFWMIISVTAHLFACLNIIMKLVGMKGVINFDLTNKAVRETQIQMYENGIFDFEGTSLLLIPLTTLSILNVATLIGGGCRVIVQKSLHDLFGQLYISCFILLISYPVLEGIIIRRDKGRVPTSITLWSIMLTVILLLLFG
ncbi:cellulose synthase-like protein G2 isoform X1 [Phoenix dactylifera]|uniref:Cellulose synthase-like protein G2 isoform X1 n=1 Tax=Phoenix dactylifera TaxID=42345 RepID=A0A8B8J035_PHODC|nr:cellulose synthase-like protein G2 isoform X1 [Phoenix dactylifera]